MDCLQPRGVRPEGRGVGRGYQDAGHGPQDTPQRVPQFAGGCWLLRQGRGSVSGHVQAMVRAMTWAKDSLMAFENRVKEAFLDKRIRAPVHLSAGNEDQLLQIFK